MGRRAFTDDFADRNCPSALFAGVLNDYIISSVCSTLLFYGGFSIAVNKKKEIYKQPSGSQFLTSALCQERKKNSQILFPRSEALANEENKSSNSDLSIKWKQNFSPYYLTCSD